MRIAIVEDEAEAAALLQRYIARWEQETGSACAVDTFTNGVDFISDYRPVYDVVFLDIEMPHMNGLTAAKKLRALDQDVLLVFVTMMAQYAIRGYEVDAIGYMVKPVEYFSFARQMQKVAGRLRDGRGEQLSIQTATNLVRIFLKDLYYVEADDHFLVYHTVQGERKLFGKLGAIEEQLAGKGFFRCNKGYLVNLRHVQRLHGNTVTVGGDELLVSRSKVRPLMAALNEYLGRK